MSATDDMKAAFARDGALLLRLLWDEVAGPGRERLVTVFLADERHLVYSYGADDRVHLVHIEGIEADADGEEWTVTQKPYRPGHGGPVLIFSPIWLSEHSDAAKEWQHSPARPLVEEAATEVFGYAL